MAETEMGDGLSRQLLPGPTDNAAAARTPGNRLRLIPREARRSFVPLAPAQPGIRLGENDLTRIAPGRPRAQGEVILVAGRITDQRARPIRHTMLEIWNANKFGKYVHHDDHSDHKPDPNFLGIGRTVTDADGNYSFLTIKPGSYLARPDINRWRPSHIHFSIRGGTARLVTQMYFAGDPHNERDPGYILLGEAQKRHIGQELAAQRDDVARGFRFDIVIGGANANYFED